MRIDDAMKLTKTEERLLNAISDGRPHKFAELMPLLDDDLASIRALQFHMSNLRTKMRQRGLETTVCEDGCYRKVAYVNS